MADRNPPTTCDLLDALLSDELDAAAAKQFETHLTSCLNCRAAVQQDRWLSELLRSADAAAMEAAPPTRWRELSQRLALARNGRRRRMTALGVAAAAAALLVGALLWPKANVQDGIASHPPAPLANRQELGSDAMSQKIASSDDSRQANAEQNAKPQIAAAVATDIPARTTDASGDGIEVALADDSRRSEAEGAAAFQGSSDVIALLLESPSPEVTVFQVYTTTDAQRRQRLEAILANASSSSPGDY